MRRMVLLTYTPRELDEEEYARFIREIDYPAFRQHPDIVERLVLVSTVFKRSGWYPEMRAGMDAMGPETADFMKQTPLYLAYEQVAPDVEDWPILVQQVSEAMKIDYDWSAAVPA